MPAVPDENTIEITCGEGRTRTSLRADLLGNDLVVRIFNTHAHIGAVAVAEFDAAHQRASVSVLTRLGHKDDTLAQHAAYSICKATQRTTCVIAGIHLDDITPAEIDQFAQNEKQIVDILLGKLKSNQNRLN